MLLKGLSKSEKSSTRANRSYDGIYFTAHLFIYFFTSSISVCCYIIRVRKLSCPPNIGLFFHIPAHHTSWNFIESSMDTFIIKLVFAFWNKRHSSYISPILFKYLHSFFTCCFFRYKDNNFITL